MVDYEFYLMRLLSQSEEEVKGMEYAYFEEERPSGSGYTDEEDSALRLKRLGLSIDLTDRKKVRLVNGLDERALFLGFALGTDVLYANLDDSDLQRIIEKAGLENVITPHDFEKV